MGRRRRKGKKGGKRDTRPRYRVNEQIRAPEVRVVKEVPGDEENENYGVYPVDDARKMAEEKELDLVEISPKADPPVCKIIDYNKFLYEQKKKQKALKQKQGQSELKEVRFGPNTDDHDFNFKLEHARKFLNEGNKVKAYVFFKGRSIVFKDRGEYLLLRLANDLEDIGVIESMPKLEGKRMIMMINPKSKK
ncbi:MAG: translation initiation factor IF-3 [Flavobacteriales bacterium]